METHGLFTHEKKFVAECEDYILQRDKVIKEITSRISEKFTDEDNEARELSNNLLVQLGNYNPGKIFDHEKFLQDLTKLMQCPENDHVFFVRERIKYHYLECKDWVETIETQQGNIVQPVIPDQKINRDTSENNDMLDADKIRLFIHSLKLENKISVSCRNTEAIQQIITENKDNYPFYIILNSSTDNNKKKPWWNSLKINCKEEAVFVDYTCFFEEECPEEIITALKTEYPDKKIWLRYNEEILPPAALKEYAYLVIYSVLRDISSLSPIGGWSNERKDISQLFYLIQKVILFASGIKNTFINRKIKPENELPFEKFINESITGLLDYKSNRENSLLYNYKVKKYETRFERVEFFVKELSKAITNEHLYELLPEITSYRDAFIKQDASSKLIKLLNVMEENIKARKEFIPSSNKSEILYNQFKMELINIASSPDVTASRYSWLGYQLRFKKVVPGKHTLKEETLGQLYSIYSNKEMDEQTKCVEMDIVMTLSRQKMNAHRSVDLNEASYVKKYSTIWNDKKYKDDVERAIGLLKHYARSCDLALFFTGQWNQHHSRLVRKAIIEFELRKNDLDVKDILDYFSWQLDDKTNPDGELVKTLCFIGETTFNEFNLMNNAPGGMEANQDYNRIEIV